MRLYEVSQSYYNKIRRDILSELGITEKNKLKVTGECAACNLLQELSTSTKLGGSERVRVRTYKELHTLFWMTELKHASAFITQSIDDPNTWMTLEIDAAFARDGKLNEVEGYQKN
jgi:hypothetical protein